jgi:hypothetical protein
VVLREKADEMMSELTPLLKAAIGFAYVGWLVFVVCSRGRPML